MGRAVRLYIRWIDRFNRRIGRFAMYLIFALVAVLLWSTGSKIISEPSLWTLEVAQYVMVAFYMLGGPYSIQLGSNVRMDLFYSNWSLKTKACVDSFTVLFLIFYLAVLFYGAVASSAYSFGYFGQEPFSYFWTLITSFVTGGTEAASEHIGHLERSSTIWRPVIWPVKLIMCVGIFLMLLQCLSEFFKDILRLRGEEITNVL